MFVEQQRNTKQVWNNCKRKCKTNIFNNAASVCVCVQDCLHEATCWTESINVKIKDIWYNYNWQTVGISSVGVRFYIENVPCWKKAFLQKSVEILRENPLDIDVELEGDQLKPLLCQLFDILQKKALLKKVGIWWLWWLSWKSTIGHWANHHCSPYTQTRPNQRRSFLSPPIWATYPQWSTWKKSW